MERVNALRKHDGVGLLTKDTQITLLALVTKYGIYRFGSYSEHQQLVFVRGKWICGYVLLMRRAMGRNIIISGEQSADLKLYRENKLR